MLWNLVYITLLVLENDYLYLNKGFTTFSVSKMAAESGSMSDNCVYVLFVDAACKYYVDVAIVFDLSDSVTTAQFETMKTLVKNTLELTSEMPKYTRVGLIVSSPTPQVIGTFNVYNSLRDVYDAINNLPYPTGSGNMVDILKVLYWDLYDTSYVSGNRVFANNVAIIITDGRSMVNASRTLFHKPTGTLLIPPRMSHKPTQPPTNNETMTTHVLDFEPGNSTGQEQSPSPQPADNEKAGDAEFRTTEREKITRVIYYTKVEEGITWQIRKLASMPRLAQRLSSELHQKDIINVIREHATQVCPITPRPDTGNTYTLLFY